LPPLRERRSDIAPLLSHFLKRFAAPGQQAPAISPDAMRLLMEYDYPGNIRELENAVEHAVVLCDGVQITPEDLPLQIQESGLGDGWDTAINGEGSGPGSQQTGGAPASHLEQAEISLIMQALEKTGYNFTRAAQHLGITRRTLGYRINKYGLYDDIMREKSQQG
jgi:two-component system NtrC family response regulator